MEQALGDLALDSPLANIQVEGRLHEDDEKGTKSHEAVHRERQEVKCYQRRVDKYYAEYYQESCECWGKVARVQIVVEAVEQLELSVELVAFPDGGRGMSGRGPKLVSASTR